MKFAIKFYSQLSNPDDVPGDWPAITLELADGEAVPPGFTEMTAAERTAYLSAHQAEFDAWQESTQKAGLARKVRERIDQRTDQLLAAGFEHEGVVFPLDPERRADYGFDYLFDMETYPRDVKGCENATLALADRAAHTAFVGAGLLAAKTIIYGGWELKDALDEMTVAQLLAWTDPRSAL